MIKSIQVQVNKRPQSQSAAIRSSAHNSISPKHSPRAHFPEDALALQGQAVEYPVVVISPRQFEYSPPVSARQGKGRAQPHTRQISEQFSLNSIDQIPGQGFAVEESPRYIIEGSLPGSVRTDPSLPHGQTEATSEGNIKIGEYLADAVSEIGVRQGLGQPNRDPISANPEETYFDDPVHLNETRLAAMLSRQRAKESIYHHGQQKTPQPPNNNQQEQRAKRNSDKPRPQSAPRRYYLDPNEAKAGQDGIVFTSPTGITLEDGLISKPMGLAGRQSRATSAKSSTRPKSRNGQKVNNKFFPSQDANSLHLHSATSATESPRDTESLQQLLNESLQEYYDKHGASMIHGDTSSVLPEVYPHGEAVGGSFNVLHTKAGPWPSIPPEIDGNKHLNLADMVKDMLAKSIEEGEGIPVRPSRPKSSLAKNRLVSVSGARRPQSATVTKSKLYQSFQNNHLQAIGDLNHPAMETKSDYVFGSLASSNVVDNTAAEGAEERQQGGAVSPGMAVMLLAHDILQKQPKPRFPKPVIPNDQKGAINIFTPTSHLQKVVNKVQQAQYLNPVAAPSSSNYNPLSLPDDLKQQMDKQLKMYKHLTFGEQLSYVQKANSKPVHEQPPVVQPMAAEPPAMFSPRTAFAIQHAMNVVEGNTTATGDIKPEFQQKIAQLQDRYRQQLLNDQDLAVVDASQSVEEGDDVLKELPPQSPNSGYTRDEIQEITLRWRKFLSHPNHPPRTAHVTYHLPTKDSELSKKRAEPPTLFYNTETSMVDNSAPNTARSQVQAADSLLPPPTDIDHNPYAVDHYDPQHLLYSPELLYNAYIEHGGLLNTANYRHPSSIPTNNLPPQSTMPAPTPDGRPISRGNYLYSFYEDQQHKLQKQYQVNKTAINNQAGPESHTKEDEDSAALAKGKINLIFNTKDKAAMRSEPNEGRANSPLTKSRSRNDLKGQNEVVRINHRVPSLRIPVGKLAPQPDHRYGSAMVISYDEQEAAAAKVNRDDFTDSYLSLDSNGVLPILVDPVTNKVVPPPGGGSPLNTAAIKRSKSKQALEDIVVQPNQSSFHDKKASHPAHTTRQSAVRYAKYVDERNKELNKVGWNNNKLKDASNKAVVGTLFPVVLDVQSPPPPVLNLAYNGFPVAEVGSIPQLASATNSRPSSKPGSRPSSANSTHRRQ